MSLDVCSHGVPIVPDVRQYRTLFLPRPEDVRAGPRPRTGNVGRVAGAGAISLQSEYRWDVTQNNRFAMLRYLNFSPELAAKLVARLLWRIGGAS